MEEWFRSALLLTGRFSASRPLAETLGRAFGIRFRAAAGLVIPDVACAAGTLVLIDCATFAPQRAHQLAAMVCTETPCALLLANAAEDDYTDLVPLAALKGILAAPVSGETLLRGIGALRRGELCFSRRLMSRQMDQMRNRDRAGAGHALLTPREWRVLLLIVEGHSNAAIAALLHVSPHTVKTHAQKIFRKINASNRTQAAHWARLHGQGQQTVEELHDGARTVA